MFRLRRVDRKYIVNYDNEEFVLPTFSMRGLLFLQ